MAWCSVKAQGQLYLNLFLVKVTEQVMNFTNLYYNVFSLHHRVQNGSGVHPASIQWVLGAISPGVKRPGREADHSHPSSSEVRNAWSYTSTPQYVFMV
jgi:hypothetical protein